MVGGVPHPGSVKRVAAPKGSAQLQIRRSVCVASSRSRSTQPRPSTSNLSGMEFVDAPPGGNSFLNVRQRGGHYHQQFRRWPSLVLFVFRIVSPSQATRGNTAHRLVVTTVRGWILFWLLSQRSQWREGRIEIRSGLSRPQTDRFSYLLAGQHASESLRRPGSLSA
jgi:hypothetical protein